LPRKNEIKDLVEALFMKTVLATSLGLTLLISLVAECAIATSPYLEQGISEYNAHHYEEAVGLFGQAQSAEFNNPVLHYYLANALSRLKQTKEAIKEYRIAIALQPQGQIAEYCQRALVSLGAAPSTEASKRGALPPATGPGLSTSDVAKPQIIGVFCGCPLCYRVELALTDLQKKYGDRIMFTHTMQHSSDLTAKFVMQRYNVSECPTVLIIDGNGGVVSTRTGAIAEGDLLRDADKLLATLPASNPTDTRVASARDAIMQEAQARVASDQRRLDEEIKMIENETTLRMADISRMRGYNYHEEMQMIQNESTHSMQALRDDFERRKKEVFAAAEAKIQALSSTSGGRNASK
jgi:tetratricopeptide (TPR) repeat protein